jgi:hypothetical protein
MKTIAKFSLIATTLAVIASSTAFADDPQLQNRLAVQRQAEPSQTTVAVYVNKRGVGRANRATPAERFELRTNPHGQTYGARVQGK